MNKRELLEKAFRLEEAEKVPIGFWHHFVLGEEQFKGLEDSSILDRIVEGHKTYYEKVNPDMMKLMSEGFMGYPPIMNNELKTAEDLRRIKSIGETHPWITEQVKHVRRLVDLFKDKVMTFYNIFSPIQVMRIKFDFLDEEFDKFVYLAENFPEDFRNAGLEIQKDITILIKKLLTETELDGIYFCVQNIQSPKFTKEVYDTYIRPTEIEALNTANQYSDFTILHICGYAGHKNKLEYYRDYPCTACNWAVHTEGVSLADGKKIFKDKCILGGFDNNPDTLIDRGSKEELEEYVKQLIDENGYKGYIIGADCSIPNNIDDTRIRYISDASYNYLNPSKK